MRKMLLLMSFLVAACTTGRGIVPLTPAQDLFIIERESPLPVPPDELASQARAEAAAFCDARGTGMEVIDTQTSKGWNVTGNVPIFRMRFRCAGSPPVTGTPPAPG
jgi:hypothetical protein